MRRRAKNEQQKQELCPAATDKLRPDQTSEGKNAQKNQTGRPESKTGTSSS
jgi:hypothetical protein